MRLAEVSPRHWLRPPNRDLRSRRCAALSRLRKGCVGNDTEQALVARADKTRHLAFELVRLSAPESCSLPIQTFQVLIKRLPFSLPDISFFSFIHLYCPHS